VDGDQAITITDDLPQLDRKPLLGLDPASRGSADPFVAPVRLPDVVGQGLILVDHFRVEEGHFEEVPALSSEHTYRKAPPKGPSLSEPVSRIRSFHGVFGVTPAQAREMLTKRKLNDLRTLLERAPAA
jgi:hypothetical protein